MGARKVVQLSPRDELAWAFFYKLLPSEAGLRWNEDIVSKMNARAKLKMMTNIRDRQSYYAVRQLRKAGVSPEHIRLMWNTSVPGLKFIYRQHKDWALESLCLHEIDCRIGAMADKEVGRSLLIEVL